MGILKEIKLTDKTKDLHLDPIKKNVLQNKEKIFYNIKSFARSNKNNGIYAENIVRMTLDAINLNHLSKNHPHVDLGVVNPIDKFTVKDEIISIKSSSKIGSDVNTILSDSKSIKIDSLFSYILYAYYNYSLNFESVFSPATLLNKCIGYALDIDPEYDDFIELVYIVTYHSMFHNDKNGERLTKSDILSNVKGEDMSDGNYDFYYNRVENELKKLNTPISIGLCYVEEPTKDNTVCVIKKTETIPLYDYWKSVLHIWETSGFFGAKNVDGEFVVKYLKFGDIKDIYGIENDFPIEIRIDTTDFSYGINRTKMSEEEREKHSKRSSERRSGRLYLATKMKDANFGNKERKILAFLGATIDSLSKNPKLVKKFNSFLPRENRVNLKRYKDD